VLFKGNARHGWALVVLGVSGALIGCDGSATAPSPVSSASGSQTTGLAAIQSQVFTPKCSGCHGNAVTQAGLSLASGSSFTSLVNVQSSQSSKLLVVPGKPDESYLVDKLEGGAGIVGDRMPKGGPFLTSAEIDTVSQWITSGAGNN